MGKGGVNAQGKRRGAGRKPGAVSVAKTRMLQQAKDVAAQVLSEVDAVAIWKKLITSPIGRRFAQIVKYAGGANFVAGTPIPLP
jgi:hypothetical protein